MHSKRFIESCISIAEKRVEFWKGVVERVKAKYGETTNPPDCNHIHVSKKHLKEARADLKYWKEMLG